MRIHFKFLRVVSMLFAGALTFMSTAQAADRGFYLGADVVSLQTTLDYYIATETYSTSHARLKAGYQILDFLSVEGRIMSAGNGTDIDFLGNQYRFETGTMFGIYARPHTNFRSANVYGILGLTAMNTRYNPVGFAPADHDLVLAETIGVGGDFRIAGNLSLNIEAQIYVGVVDYPMWLGTADLYGYGLSAGLRYRF